MSMQFPKWKVSGNKNLASLCPQLHQHPDALDLLTQMLQLEPSKRITIKAALDHPFFMADSGHQLSSSAFPNISSIQSPKRMPNKSISSSLKKTKTMNKEN